MADPAKIIDSEDQTGRPTLQSIEGGAQGDGVPQGELSSVSGNDELRTGEGIYDDGAGQPFLQSLPGGAEGDGVARGNLSSVPSNDKNTPDNNALRDAEEDPDETDKLGKGYSDDNTPKAPSFPSGVPVTALSPTARVLEVLWGPNQKKGVAIGGPLGIVLAITISLLMMMAPAKLTHMMENIQDHFFAGAESALSKTIDRLVGKYIVSYVMPGMVDGRCTTTLVHNSCAIPSKSGSTLSVLFNAMRDGNFEGKLASKYGIELIRKGSGQNSVFYIKAPNLDPKGVELGKYLDFVQDQNGDMMAKLSRNNSHELRKIFANAVEEETKWKKVAYRILMRDLLTRKYDASRCAILCSKLAGLRDWKADNITSPIELGRGVIANKITGPISQKQALIVECALSSFDCADYLTPDASGARITRYQENLAQRLREYHASGADVEELMKDVKKAQKVGIKQYGTEKAILLAAEKAGVKLSAKAVADFGTAATAVGLIDATIALQQGAVNAGPAVKKLEYSYASSIMVDYFSTYRAAADELKIQDRPGDSNFDADTYGGLTQTLSEGGYDITQSPRYQQVVEGKTSSDSSWKEACDEEPTDGATVCPNETLVANDGSILVRGAMFESKGTQFICENAELIPSLGAPYKYLCDMGPDWLRASGAVTGWALSLAGKPIMAIAHTLPDQVIDKISAAFDAIQVEIGKLFSKFSNFLFTSIFISPQSNESSGINTINLVIGGADILGNDFTREVVGGEVTTIQTADKIRNDYLAEKDADFRRESLAKRIFDTNDHRSAISRFALSLPGSFSTATLYNSLADKLFRPFAQLASIVSLPFGPRNVSASGTVDEQGVTQYAVPADSPVYNKDLEQVEKEYDCSNPNQAADWANTYDVLNEDNQQYETTKGNPCKTLYSGAQVIGATMSTKLQPTTTTAAAASAQYSADGWEWPIKNEDWPKLSMPISECGLRYSNGDVHTGMDISAPSGTAVYAAASGKVSMRSDSWGAINIETAQTSPSGDKLYVNYQHMSQTLVSEGDTVSKGQLVGYSGSTGTGAAHLHFGIWKTNEFLGGHNLPGTPAGARVVALIENPYNYMPKDGRNVNECQ